MGKTCSTGRSGPDAVNPLEIHLYEAYTKPWNPTYSEHPDPTLTSRFQFDTERKDLIRLSVWGPFLTSRLDKLKKEVDKHPDWPDARVVEALKSAGAKFGPDDRAEFVRTLPLKELEPLTGRLEVVSAEFRVRFTPAEGNRPGSDLRWSVEAKWHSPDGRHEADCLLILEPFEGALMDFHLRSLPKPIP
jgi:hypothetical protein